MVSTLAASLPRPYALCPPNAPADLVCDPGVAAAVDEVEGDLLSIGLVTACGPASYLAAAGLAGCTHVKLDVPGTYVVSFSVTNSEVCGLAVVSLGHPDAACVMSMMWLPHHSHTHEAVGNRLSLMCE